MLQPQPGAPRMLPAAAGGDAQGAASSGGQPASETASGSQQQQKMLLRQGKVSVKPGEAAQGSAHCSRHRAAQRTGIQHWDRGATHSPDTGGLRGTGALLQLGDASAQHRELPAQNLATESLLASPQTPRPAINSSSIWGTFWLVHCSSCLHLMSKHHAPAGSCCGHWLPLQSRRSRRGPR